jgi:hypothetical protein
MTDAHIANCPACGQRALLDEHGKVAVHHLLRDGRTFSVRKFTGEARVGETLATHFEAFLWCDGAGQDPLGVPSTETCCEVGAVVPHLSELT